MINHSISHGSVALVSLLGTQMLADKLKEYLPTIYAWIELGADWIVSAFNLSIRQSHVESIVLVIIIGSVWGAIFWNLSVKPTTR